MLLLTSTSDVISVVTANAVATHVQASWMDYATSTVTPGRTNTIISTATTTTIVAAPAPSTQRNIKRLSISAAGGQQTITVRHTDGTNVVEILDIVLLQGEQAVLNDTAGWQVYTSNGALKSGTTVIGAFPMLNVVDYGATGDGITDDLAAIQTAITAAAVLGVGNRGVDLFFPAGVYNVSGAITCPYSNIMLRGSGWQSTVIYCTSTSTDVIQFGNGISTTAAGCGLMNMSVWKSAAATAGSSININKMNDVLIQNFVVNNCFIGINVQGGSIKVWIDQGEINNVTAATGHGIQVTNGAAGDTYISNVVMSNNPASKPASGINIVQTGHTSILRCNITSALKGLLVNPTTSQDVSYLFIDHSLFDSCGTHGAHFTPSAAASARVRSVMCVNSWFSGTTAAGGGVEMTVASSAIVDGVSFVGCRILNNFQHGVIINAGPQNISFTDCSISGNGQNTVNTYDGISIAANVSNVSVLNCGIGQQGTAGNQQRYAINVAAGTSSNLQFIVNNCQPNGTVGTFGYINTGTLTGGGNIITGNIPQPDVSVSSCTVAASAAINTTETVVSAPLRYSANGLRVGSKIRFAAFGTCTTTAANISTFRVRMGTAGTTSDGVIMTVATTAAGTTGTTVPFRMMIELTVRTIGASGTFYGDAVLVSNTNTGIIAAGLSGVYIGTAAAGSTQTANFITLTYQSAAATTTSTFQNVSIETVAP